jgi:hypothetical protein
MRKPNTSNVWRSLVNLGMPVHVLCCSLFGRPPFIIVHDGTFLDLVPPPSQHFPQFIELKEKRRRQNKGIE